MAVGEHKIFCRKYSKVFDETSFDEVDILQNNMSTKSFFDEMV